MASCPHTVFLTFSLPDVPKNLDCLNVRHAVPSFRFRRRLHDNEWCSSLACNTWGCLSLGAHVIVEGESPSLAAIVEREVQVAVFKRITVRPEQMGGIPCIRGLRIPVATVVGMVSEGMAEAEILKSYPDLELEDIREALRYAAEAVRERELPVAGGS